MPGFGSGFTDMSRLFKFRRKARTKARREKGFTIGDFVAEKLPEKKPLGDYGGFHHQYLGWISILLGLVIDAVTWFVTWKVQNVTIGIVGTCILIPLYLFGIIAVLDDRLQHFFRLGDKTPFRIVHNWLKNFKWYQKLTIKLDKIFGKK